MQIKFSKSKLIHSNVLTVTHHSNGLKVRHYIETLKRRVSGLTDVISSF